MDPRFPKIYNTWGLWRTVSKVWPPPWSKVGVGLDLEELGTNRDRERFCELLSPLALCACGEKNVSVTYHTYHNCVNNVKHQVIILSHFMNIAVSFYEHFEFWKNWLNDILYSLFIFNFGLIGLLSIILNGILEEKI